MAIYQYKVMMVPNSARHAFEALPPPSVLGEDFFVELPSVTFAMEATEIVRRMEAILPRSRSWPDMIQFGDDNVHDAAICLDNGVVSEVSFRIDLRDDNPRELILKIVHLAVEADCCFCELDTFAVFSAEPPLLVKHLLNSRAARFLRDPEAFFRSFPHGMQTDDHQDKTQ
jgi:hypothetical protein